MRIRSIFLAVLLAGAAVAGAQDTFKPGRTYKVGESDTYTLKMTMSTQMGDISINGESTQTVKKVYDNGDADIEVKADKMVVNVGGNEMTPPSQPATMMKVNKFGVPLSVSGGEGKRNMNFSRFLSYYGDKELKVGETFAFDVPDKEKPKNHSKGSVKLASLENGKATLDISVDNFTEGSDEPMHVEGTAVVDASSGKMLKFHGTAKGIPSGQGMTISSAEFTMEHKG